MILEEATFKAFGYEVWELTRKSGKPIIAACDKCDKVRETSKNNYRAFCRSCSMKSRIFTEAWKANMSASLKCKNNPNFGKRGAECSNYNGGKRVVNSRTHAKRKRQLGYMLLMPLKEGEVGHHITNMHVVGIPTEVHQRFSGYKRRKHRTLVLQWLKVHDKRKYKMVLCVLAKESLY